MTTRRSFQKFSKRLEGIGLLKDVEKLALAAHVTLHDLYDGERAPSIVAARRVVYLRLIEDGKSLNEIARLFDRASSGVLKLTKSALKASR
jgi:hypothetical protein